MGKTSHAGHLCLTLASCRSPPTPPREAGGPGVAPLKPKLVAWGAEHGPAVLDS